MAVLLDLRRIGTVWSQTWVMVPGF